MREDQAEREYHRMLTFLRSSKLSSSGPVWGEAPHAQHEQFIETQVRWFDDLKVWLNWHRNLDPKVATSCQVQLKKDNSFQPLQQPDQMTRPGKTALGKSSNPVPRIQIEPNQISSIARLHPIPQIYVGGGGGGEYQSQTMETKNSNKNRNIMCHFKEPTSHSLLTTKVLRNWQQA